MIRAIIFDFNGIFVTPVEDKIFSKLAVRFGANMIHAKAKYLFLLKKLQEGKMPSKDFWKRIFPKLSERDFAKIEEEYKKIRRHPRAFELAKSLSGHFNVLCLSNSNDLQTKHFKKQKLYSCFKKVFLSNQTGHMKPFPSAFKFLLKSEKLRAEECIFVDDSRKNVLAARALGFKTINFGSIKKFI